MRVRRSLRNTEDGERGATAVIVAVALTAIFSAAVLSVDAGSLWRTRRNLITDSDAGALAAARMLDAAGSNACSSSATSAAEAEARTVVAANDASTRVTGFSVTPTGGSCSAESGRVRVDTMLSVDLTFAGAIGISNVDAASSSIAQWGPLTSAIGLRPVGICDKSEPFLAWTRYLAGNEPRWGSLPGQTRGSNGEVVNAVELQLGSSGCGSASGNWDWLDFNGGAQPNGTEALKTWLQNGYDGAVSLSDPDTGISADCNPEQSGNQPSCEPKTGATGGSTTGSLEYLRQSGIVFPILVYDRVVDQRDPLECKSTNWDGNGVNARFCQVAFLLVRLHGWSGITGNSGTLRLEFVDQWWVGTIGRNPSGGRPTTHGVSLCGGGYGTTIDQTCDV